MLFFLDAPSDAARQQVGAESRGWRAVQSPPFGAKCGRRQCRQAIQRISEAGHYAAACSAVVSWTSR